MTFFSDLSPNMCVLVYTGTGTVPLYDMGHRYYSEKKFLWIISGKKLDKRAPYRYRYLNKRYRAYQ